MIWTDGYTSLDTEGMVAQLYERGAVDDIYPVWRVNNMGKGVRDFIEETAAALEKSGGRRFRGWVAVPDVCELTSDDLAIGSETISE